MMHGYYLAATRQRCGDPLLARLARLLWHALGHRAPSRVDGASVWWPDDGPLETCIIARDLFENATWKCPKKWGDYPAFETPKVLRPTQANPKEKP
jgi:hypothetical protein